MQLLSSTVRRRLEQHWHRLYRIAYAWSHDPQQAKDLVQETMMKALNKHDQLKDAALFDVWLFRIMLNAWRDICRSRKHDVELVDANHYHEHSPEFEHQRASLVSRVRKAVAGLSQEHREIITLVDLEQMSYKEVAEIMQIPIGTVMSRICRARQQLRDALKDLNQGEAQIRRIK